MVGRVDDGVGIVGLVVKVVGGRGCRKAQGVDIEQGCGHGCGAQAGVGACSG